MQISDGVCWSRQACLGSFCPKGCTQKIPAIPMDGPVSQPHGHGATEMQHLRVPSAVLLLKIFLNSDLDFHHCPYRGWSCFSIHHLIWRMYPSLEALEPESTRALLEC